MNARHLIVFVAMLSGLLHAQSVDFAISPAKAGVEYRSTLKSQMVLQGDEGGTLTTTKVKDVKILATSDTGVTQLQVKYTENNKTSSVPEMKGHRSITEGRTYIAHKSGEVTNPTGNEVSRDEAREVARDMKVGEPNSVAKLAGKTFVVGATIAPEAMRSLLEDELRELGIDEVESVAVTLSSVTETAGVPVAIFSVRFEAFISKGFRAKISMSLAGKVAVVANSCSLVGLDLEGPVKIVEQKGLRPVRRRLSKTETTGKFSLSLKMSAIEKSPTVQPGAGTDSGAKEANRGKDQNPLVGKWRTQNPGEVVQIRSIDGKLVGEVVESSSEGVTPGLRVIESIDKDGDAWKCKVYIPKRDMRLDGKMTLSGDTLAIEVSAGPTTKKSTWTRLQ